MQQTHWRVAEKNRGKVGGAGCSEAVGCLVGADLRGKWTVAAVMVGETSSLIGESVGKCARNEQASCIVPSPVLPPQAASYRSQEGCPAPLQLISCAKTKKYGPNERTEQNLRKRAKWVGYI